MEERISERRKVQLGFRTTLNEACLHIINGLATPSLRAAAVSSFVLVRD